MNDCERIQAAIAAWENEGTFARTDLQKTRTHCESCQSCAVRVAPLLALLERDAGAGDDRSVPATGLADRVMARVRFSSPRRRLPVAAWAAVAAVVVLAVGVSAVSLSRGWGSPGSDEVVVRFELEAPGASSVALAGSFTDWNTSRLMMSDPGHDGVWQITVRLKKDSVAVYNFVIDGTRWVVDPRVPAQVDDGFGGHSSVLKL